MIEISSLFFKFSLIAFAIPSRLLKLSGVANVLFF